MTRNRTHTTRKASTACKPTSALAQTPAVEKGRADIY